MVCEKCGKELENGTKNCPECGAKTKKKTNLLPFIITGIIVVIISAVVITVILVIRKPIANSNNQLSIEEQYLEAQDYDTALQMYLDMLEEDPVSLEGYLGTTETYLRMGDYDKALECAQAGYDLTNDEKLLEKIEMINSGNITDSKGRTLKMTFVEDGEVKWWHEYTYNANGQPNSITVYDSNGNQVDYGEYEYDSDGRCTVDVGGYAWADGMLDKYLYYYDEKGRMIREENGDNSNFWIKRVTEYLYQGNEKEAYRRNLTMYDENGDEKEQKYELIKGNIHEIYNIESDGTEWLEEVHEWNDDDNGKTLSYTYTIYDKSGNITDYDLTVYEYDENGKKTKEITYDEEGNVENERNYQ